MTIGRRTWPRRAESEAPDRAGTRQGVRFLIIGLAALGFFLTYITFYPGLITLDSSDQFGQAQTLYFRDWHPPIMAWLWSWLDPAEQGPVGLFLLFTSLYWASFLLIALHISSLRISVGVCSILLPYAPFLFALAGTIWKDVLVLVCFLAATALVLPRLDHRKVGAVRILAGCAMLLIGSMARHNSALAAGPLLVLYIWPREPQTRRLLRTCTRVIVASTIAVVIGLGGSKVANRFLFKAEQTHIESALFLWDLVAISDQIKENLVPGAWTEAESQQIVNRCYVPSSINAVMFYSCSFVYSRLLENGTWEIGLFRPWLRAILEHPREYLLARLRYVRTLAWPTTVFVFVPEPESFRFGFQNNLPFRIVSATIQFIKATPPFYFMLTVLFWMLVAIVATLVTAAAFLLKRPHAYPALLLALSAVVYVWPLVLIGTGGDFRFCYWCATASLLAFLLTASAPARRLPAHRPDRIPLPT